jgi:hypothetical protein
LFTRSRQATGKERCVPEYVVEPELPGAVNLSAQEQQEGISQTSCNVLSELGPRARWVESQATDDKTYRAYMAQRRGDPPTRWAGRLPGEKISEVRSTTDPTSAEA